MAQWRVYYDDGSTFDSDQGPPAAAPSVGFIVAVGYDEAGDRYLMHGWDHYCWSEQSNQWWGMDLMGVFDRLRRNVLSAYKEGRTVTKAEWNVIMERAHQDPDFPFGVKR